jgi:hypothetical protein
MRVQLREAASVPGTDLVLSLSPYEGRVIKMEFESRNLGRNETMTHRSSSVLSPLCEPRINSRRRTAALKVYGGLKGVGPGAGVLWTEALLDVEYGVKVRQIFDVEEALEIEV